jgi:hypothetical protein
MAKKRRSKKDFPEITFEEIKRVNRLIPDNRFESITARTDKLAIWFLQKMFGADWIAEHVMNSKQDDFLSCSNATPQIRETRRIRRIMLMETIYNLKTKKGFRSCLEKLKGGQIESTFAVFDVARLLVCMASDKGLTFRFVTECGIPHRDYDLSVMFSDGLRVPVEAKCKQEETEITLRTIERSLSHAKSQLPKSKPGIIFLKVPRLWIEDENFTMEMRKLAQRFLQRSPSIVSVKFHTHVVTQQQVGSALLPRGQHGESVAEVMAVREENNERHKFRKFRERSWKMFPDDGPIAPPPYINYNGMPNNWQRLLVERSDRI